MEDLERLKQRLLNVQRHNIDIGIVLLMVSERQRHLTASKGNRCVAEVLVRAGADVNAQNKLRTALHRCCGRVMLTCVCCC